MFDWYRGCAYDGEQKKRFIAKRGSLCVRSQRSCAFPRPHMTCGRTALASPLAVRSLCTMIGSTSKSASLRQAPTAEF